MKRSPPCRSSLRLCAAFVLGAVIASPAPAAIFYVGAASDDDCDATTIPAALFGAAFTAEADEVRVANNQAYTNQRIIVGRLSVTIRGGYSDCTDTTAAGTGTTLDADGGVSSPVISIDNTDGATRSRVDLVNLTLTGGEEGGLEATGNVTVVLFNSRLSFNAPARGAEVGDTASLTLRGGSSVDNNGLYGVGGVFGGGIRCDNASVDIEDAHVFNNMAWGGGGIYGSNCQVQLARTYPILFGAPGGVFNNAALLGGGIYLDDGAQLYQSPFTGQTIIHDNEADVGGGLYITGTGSRARLDNTAIVDNQASGRGGGAYVTADALLTMQRENGCSAGLRCSLLADNVITGTAADDGGAGVFVDGGARAMLRQTLIEGNRSDFGAAGWVEGGGELELESSVVAKNVTWNAFQVMDGALRMKLVSATSNGLPDPTAATSLYVMGDSSSEIEVFSSVMDDHPLGAYVDSGDGHRMDCVIAPTNPVLLPGTITRYHRLSPGFRDVAGGDYHLRPTSPAIDLCDASVAAPTAGLGDIDRNTRPIDLLAVANEHGSHDAGADEVTGTEFVTLFSDGFESGGTGAWSAAVP